MAVFRVEVEGMSGAGGAGWARMGGPWIGLLGLGMVVGGVLAWWVAVARVMLPYDEEFLGLTRAELAAVNGRLLPFMAHDRVTLAGTMISIGVLYGQLALHALRRGERWSWTTVMISGSVG